MLSRISGCETYERVKENVFIISSALYPRSRDMPFMVPIKSSQLSILVALFAWEIAAGSAMSPASERANRRWRE